MRESMHGSPRFLVVRRDNIGDLVCTTPLIAALRRRHPDAWIGVLANSYNAPVLEGNPDIDAIFAYEKAKHSGKSRLRTAIERIGFVLRLRRRRLDAVVIATPEFQKRTARLARALGAQQVIGYAPARGRTPLLDIAVDSSVVGALTEVERVFRLAPALGIEGPPPPLRVVASATERERVRAALVARGIREDCPVIGIHISARKPSQRWPVERFAAVMRELHARHDAAFLLFWAPGAADNPTHPGDDAKAAALIDASGALPILPWPTHALAELIAGLDACRQVILADGGAMHIAAGLGKPLVCLFGDSDAARWRPWGVPHVLLQTPGRNVGDIDVADVVDAYETLRGKTG